MQIKSYPKYKDSDIPWIGKIPEEWEVNKLKHICNTVAGGTPSTVNLEYWDGDIPWLPSGMVHNNIIGTRDVFKFITLEGLNNSSTKKIRKDSPLIALTGATCGNIAYLTFEATANQSVVGMETNKKSNAKYLYYYLISQREQILINKTGGAQSGINEQNVKDIFCSYPSLTEQTAIANFLDKKIAEIDDLIEKDKKIIGLLKEKRTALINHAVTKGLDQNVKMKDSGIEWIGEIPEDWEILRLRYLLKNGIEGIKIGPFGSMLKSDEITNNGYKVYGQENVINRNFNKGSRYISEDKFKQLIGYQIHPGDLIITMMGTIGKAQIIPTIIDEGIMDSHLIRLRFNGKVETKFIEILINSSNYIKGEIKYFSKGSIMEGLNSGIIKDLLLCIPQKIEQTKIIQFVNRKVTKMDKTIQKIEEKIKFLEEYKKSLIHHAVTGKIDIREVKI